MKRVVPLAGLALTLLADPAAALAEVRGPGQDVPLNLPSGPAAHALTGSTPGGGGGSLVKTVVALAVVVAAIYGLYFVLKMVKRSREERAHGTGLHTVASVPLGPNRSVHLVRAGTDLVLVGVAEQGVVPIRTYTEEEAAAAGLLELADAEAPAEAPAAGEGGETTRRKAGRGPTIGELLDALRARTVRG